MGSTSRQSADGSGEDFAQFADIPLRVTIELGRRTMKVREVLQLRPQSIVEIPKSAGESTDIFINGKLIGFGEVLEMEGSAGIRLTDFFVPQR